MAVTQVWNGRWMGMDTHSAAVNAVMGRRFIDGRLGSFIKKKNCTVLMTSDITWRHQYSATVYLKIKVGMEWVSEFEALHFNTLHDHYSTTLHHHHHHYYRALCSLHCTVLTTLNCAHIQCTTITPLPCTTTSTLHCICSTALCSLHCTTTAPVHCTHCTAPPLLHCTVMTPLHCANYTALHCTVLASLYA